MADDLFQCVFAVRKLSKRFKENDEGRERKEGEEDPGEKVLGRMLLEKMGTKKENGKGKREIGDNFKRGTKPVKTETH